MWRIGWAPNNASKWQVGFKSAFKGLNKFYCKLPEDVDDIETCRSYAIEKYVGFRIVDLLVVPEF
jgi:hypothetical protein